MPQPTITQQPSSSPDETLQTEAIPPKPVADLLAKAETELQAGQLERSTASLERALRIAPKTAVLWQRLAQVHLRQGDARQAEAMAMKSNSLVSAGSLLLRKNWEIIAAARQRLGDSEGARYAAEQAQRAASAR
jgi:Tfp pilus assembly protein PilF